jgi:hypothetical protein
MDKSPFIKVRSILRKPGNPVVDCFIRTDSIVSVSRADDEMIKTGAACLIDNATGTIAVVDSVEDIIAAISHAEKAAV